MSWTSISPPTIAAGPSVTLHTAGGRCGFGEATFAVTREQQRGYAVTGLPRDREKSGGFA
jgi:hypothetical protein